jgi:hypothetical protein
MLAQMMSKIDDYRQKLKKLDNWIPYLKMNSGLPGPRGNLELAQAVVEEANEKQIEEFLSFSSEKARENTPEVFILFCGVFGLGKLIANGNQEYFTRLRTYASDHRWRIREATAMALQLVGDQNMNILLKELKGWSTGNWLERRAVAAGLAEPRLLIESRIAHQILKILDEITNAIASAGDRANEEYKVLRQAMGYCWSVVVAALPEAGKPMMEKWIASEDRDIRWIMKENLKKNRLIRMDADWVQSCNQKFGSH